MKYYTMRADGTLRDISYDRFKILYNIYVREFGTAVTIRLNLENKYKFGAEHDSEVIVYTPWVKRSHNEFKE